MMRAQAQAVTTYLTINEVADYLKIPEETIYKHVRSGRMPAAKIGRHWRFARSELDGWVARQSNERRRGSLHVLVLGSEGTTRHHLTDWLHESGCTVTFASDIQRALDVLIRPERFDFLFLDLSSPSLRSARTIEEIRTHAAGATLVLMVTSFHSRLVDSSLERGPVLALRHPPTRESVMSILDSRRANLHQRAATGRTL